MIFGGLGEEMKRIRELERKREKKSEILDREKDGEKCRNFMLSYLYP
jgi:hypothetical protein